MFLAFPLGILCIFTLLPTVGGIALSFFEWSGGMEGANAPKFVGLANYARLWRESGLAEAWTSASGPVDFIARLHGPSAPLGAALINTLIFALLTVPLTILIGFLTAAGLQAKWCRGSAALRTIYFVPTILSVVAVGFIWRWILDPSPVGLLNQVWDATMGGNGREVGGERVGGSGGGPPEWLGNSAWGLMSVIVVSLWRNAGFATVMYQAALANVNRAQYEAAALDGAGRWRMLWSVSWPGVRATTMFLAVTGAISALQVFDIVIVMIGSVRQEWTEVLNFALYREFARNELGYAAAIGCLILALSAGVAAGQLRWASWRAQKGAARG